MSWKDCPQNIKTRLITAFFSRLINSAIMPFMAIFLTDKLNNVYAGFILVIIVIVGFFSNLIGGYLTDRFDRKNLLVYTTAFRSISLLIMTISLLYNNLFYLFLFFYFVHTVFSNLSGPALKAIIVDTTTPENRHDVYVLEYWLANLSIALGVAIGGLLYTNHQVALFISMTLCSLLITITYQIWLDEGNHKKLIKKFDNILIDLLNSYKIAIQDRKFLKSVIGFMCLLSAEFTLNSYIGVRLSQEFSPFFLNGFKIDGIRMLSFLNIENTILIVCLTLITTKIIKKINIRGCLLLGLSFYTIGYIVIIFSNNWYILLIFFFIATLGELIYLPLLKSNQANMMPEDKRGSYSALLNLSTNGAEIIARSTIIIGAYFTASTIALYMGVILTFGSILVYTFISSTYVKVTNH